MCKIALRDIETEYITAIAFDGFQTFIPKEALQCTTALIKCARDVYIILLTLLTIKDLSHRI
jgi:hypothetical protein